MADLTQYVRKGESFSLTITTDDTTATTATLKVGTPGSDPLISVEGALTDGSGTISVTSNDTDIDTGTYKYEIDITSDAGTDIFPDPTKGAQDLPNFVITESFN